MSKTIAYEETMGLSKTEARSILTERNLRATAPRVAVMRILAASDRPMSHSEVLEKLGSMDWDPATIYRNLVKLRESGIAPVVSRVDGIDRYVLQTEQEDIHHHPHFSCDDCGQLTCLPDNITNTAVLEGPWAKAVQQASVQLRGKCPECTVVL
ncbi:MAG: Fur family transcriptional regulator [Bradymonadia bacterium]